MKAEQVFLHDMLPGSKLCRSDKSCKRSRCFLHMSPGRKLCRVDKSYRQNSLSHASPESTGILHDKSPGRKLCRVDKSCRRSRCFRMTCHQAANCCVTINKLCRDVSFPRASCLPRHRGRCRQYPSGLPQCKVACRRCSDSTSIHEGKKQTELKGKS